MAPGFRTGTIFHTDMAPHNTSRCLRLDEVPAEAELAQKRKIDFGPGCRVYFGRDGNVLVVLLGGSSKQRQQEAIAAAKQVRRKKQTEGHPLIERVRPEEMHYRQLQPVGR